MIAVNAAKDAGANVGLVLSIVDRQEGAEEFFKREGIKFQYLFTANDFFKPIATSSRPASAATP
jgi:orotate phosphoribosyltransferase